MHGTILYKRVFKRLCISARMPKDLNRTDSCCLNIAHRGDRRIRKNVGLGMNVARGCWMLDVVGVVVVVECCWG